MDRARPEDVVEAIYDKARAGSALGVSPFQLDALFGTETEA